MMYLVTGATGEIGSRVVECLLRSEKRVRVFARNVEKARLRFGNRVDIFSRDLADPGSLRPALEQVEGLFLVSTGPEIPRYDRSAARVAKTVVEQPRHHMTSQGIHRPGIREEARLQVQLAVQKLCSFRSHALSILSAPRLQLKSRRRIATEGKCGN